MSEALLNEFEHLVRAKIASAFKEFDVQHDPRDVTISMNIRGRVGGRAYMNRDELFLDFNRVAILEHWEFMVDNTITHEIAHLIAFVSPHLRAKGHNRNWKYIDIQLGGTGNRTHPMPLAKVRKTTWYLYNVAGKDIQMSAIRHKRLIAGKRYSIKSPRGNIRISTEDYTGRTMSA